ncbi:alpha-galactosidase [Granulicella arctica]|uniref:Alpha-galactosidase n=1 Tax=Granulicella arctica TaxID=940613 RepID=A0A7Y9PFX0_9BACT|nr:alpha-galactosidase [Granulicella arctica]
MRLARLNRLLPLLLLCPVLLIAQSARSQSIRYLEDKKLFVLEAGPASYVFGINQRGELQHVYWGGSVTRDADFKTPKPEGDWASFDLTTTTTPQEYAGWGAGLFSEPALKVTWPDGNRDLVLHYDSHKIAGNTLTVTLKDISRPIYVALQYEVYPETGIIKRQSTIENRGKTPILIESAQAATWTLPKSDNYRLRSLTGRWAGEWQLQEQPVNPGMTEVLESRRGSTSHQANPWFALDQQGSNDQEHGDVFFGALAWSGNWRISIEETPEHRVRVTGGYNPFDFGYTLAAGQSLDTPAFYAGYTGKGIGEASRLMHRFERTKILPDSSGLKTRPILYNSWEATEFSVDEQGQKSLADKAAAMGIERFVMDDGWFGKRNGDHAGLGDWYVNPQKFPHGLGSLISYVNGLGMSFGLWVEPEMVNPDSDLYRKHPDWAMHFDGRPHTEGRNQLLLNLAREDVKEYTFHWLDDLVTNNKIAFLKWDYNRNFSEPGWPEVPVDQQKKIWVQFTKNYYEIIDRLRQKHPGLEIETCSGGGGRVDLGILQRTDEVWPSDNTEAFDRLRIQRGFTYAYTPHIMMAWVTDVPNMNGRSVSLQYRFLVAMQGSLAVGSNLNKFSEAELSESKQFVASYKEIRETVQTGLLYRLTPATDNDFIANEYVAEDGKQAAVFAFLHSQQLGSSVAPLHVLGLDEQAVYRIRVIETPSSKEASTSLGSLIDSGTLSGAYLMHHGIDLTLHGDYDSALYVLEKVPNETATK